MDEGVVLQSQRQIAEAFRLHDFQLGKHACNQFGACCATWDQQCNGGGGGGSSVDEFAFQQGIGAFLKNGERGFRGLDFQARLVWEDRFGTCAKPLG